MKQRPKTPKNICEDLSSASASAQRVRKSQSGPRDQPGNTLLILTSQPARILPEPRWCEGKLVEMRSTLNKRGATEQDGEVGKTEKIILSISFAHHARNRCREDECAADTNQVYWIFIAMLASWSMTLGSTLNWLSRFGGLKKW